MLRPITLSRTCAFAAFLSLVVGICCVFVLWSGAPVALQVLCERFLRPGELLSAAILPAAYGQIICESTPPRHAALVAASAAVVFSAVFWTIVVAAIFFVRRFLSRPRHATQSI